MSDEKKKATEANGVGHDVDEKKPDANRDCRVCIVGNVDSGKSTLIGVLTTDTLDNGRGLARSKVFLHKHEADSGRTSAVGQHILGFDNQGAIVPQTVAASASSQAKTKSWAAVVSQSESILTLIDLCGHEKYLKSTIAGLTGTFPDYAIVVIGANMGITKMTKEHLGVVIALNIPCVCVVTKIDMCPPNVLERTKKHLHGILKNAKKKPFVVREENDVQTIITNPNVTKICPIHYLSTVTGENLDLLKLHLSKLRPRRAWQKLSSVPSPQTTTTTPTTTTTSSRTTTIPTSPTAVEFNLDETFTVTGVGLVVSGTVSLGRLEENSTMLLGPFHDRSFRKVLAKTVHCKRVPVHYCDAGNSCSIAIRSVNRKQQLRRNELRRGMVMVDVGTVPCPSRRFRAQILILHHPTTIKTSYQAVIHCGMVRQVAALCHLDREFLRTGDTAMVEFEFMLRPEVIHEGTKFVFREGNTKGMGKVVEVLADGDASFPSPADESTVSDSKTNQQP